MFSFPASNLIHRPNQFCYHIFSATIELDVSPIDLGVVATDKIALKLFHKYSQNGNNVPRVLLDCFSIAVYESD